VVGTTFGRYLIENEIGRGGMGVVYRARDIRLDRPVAIKVLSDRLRSDHAAWGRLLREARTASALNHPGISTIYDVGEENEQPYIAMEYIEGQPLSMILMPAGLPAARVVHYGGLIAGAMAHAHERGIIHRDLKASNVVITPSGEPKILDFGLAQRRRSDTTVRASASRSSLLETDRMAGTVSYLAPEILRGKRASESTDIWSLGVLLYEMSTGRPPFHGRTVFELATTIMTSAPAPLPREIPRHLAAIIGRCLQRDPSHRPRLAKDVCRAIHAKNVSDSVFDLRNLVHFFRHGWNRAKARHWPDMSRKSFEFPRLVSDCA
jgi:serine/threonine protein kinase